jgi:hypothetical protein
MPRLKAEPVHPLTVLVFGTAAARRVKTAKLCEWARCTQPTLGSIRDNPEGHLKQVKAIAKGLGIHKAEFLAAIPYD